jgi:hypothetical protein
MPDPRMGIAMNRENVTRKQANIHQVVSFIINQKQRKSLCGFSRREKETISNARDNVNASSCQ